MIIILVATQSDNPFIIGFVIFAQMLPTAVFGVFMGPLADRFSKRLIMAGMDIYRMIIVLLMLFAQHHVWLILALIVLEGVGTSLFEPARSASISLLVKKEKLAEAVGLSQGTAQAMMIIAPAAAGLLFLLKDNDLIFIIDACTFIVSAAILLTIKELNRKSEENGPGRETEGYLLSIGRGIRTVFGLPVLRFLILFLIPMTLAAGVLNTNINALFLMELKVPAAKFGFLDATVGMGAVLGALASPYIIKRMRPGVMLLASTGAIGIWMFLALVLPHFSELFGLSPVFVWSFLVGGLNALLNVPVSALFLGITPQEFLGRGSAILQATVNWGQMAGILLGGYAANLAGTLYATAGTGVFMVLATMVFPFLRGFKDLYRVKSEAEQVA
ncbi:MFS transporter [Caenibacillus caldisaponilyticus]|uniref:MFS transporter n=1 Tax=Caenibacillus caldisaponilyticus TaxID=1674942 RepID=UPI0013012226|nr:MFS transporter [Caenibacillus caldisaponilyticus]